MNTHDKHKTRGGGRWIAGFDALRVFMSFCVVLCHFWENNRSGVFYEMLDFTRSCAVHCFVLLAFYFSAGYIESGSCKSLWKRMLRLLKPYLIWPLVTFCIYNVSSLLISGSVCYDLTDLGYQYFMGHTQLEAVMYFNWDLMLLTVFFTGIFALFRKRTAAAVLSVLAAAASAAVYSGFNYSIFSYFPFEMKYTLGRLAELLPSAAVGIMLSHAGFQDIKAAAARSGSFIYGAAVFELVWMLYAARGLAAYFQWRHFGYGRPDQIIAAVLFFILCYYIPVNTVSRPFFKIVRQIAGYTQGIYCIHYIAGRACVKIAGESWQQINSSIFPCAVIYVISLLLAAGIAKLPWSWCREIVS